MTKPDSEAYTQRRNYFKQLLTIFGRLTVLEALQDSNIEAVRLHVSSSNKPAKVLEEIYALAESRGAEILEHDRLALSRISKNAKQDQGIALDIKPKGFSEFDASSASAGEYIALDRITNPQNLGMIIRSICASSIAGLILPRKGCANLDALVIKASAGTLFRAPIFRCDNLHKALKDAREYGADIIGLDLTAKSTLSDCSTPNSSTPSIFVLGNESDGISKEISQLCTKHARIPMNNGVESLNVAVTASLIALRHQI